MAIEGEGVQPGEGAISAAVVPEENVTISKETYESLLAAVAENTEATRKILSKVDEDDEAAAAEARKVAATQRSGRYAKVSSPEEFAAMLVEDVRAAIIPELMQSAIQPIANTVMSIVVAEELKTAKAAHSDFDTFKDDIFKETSANPKLTIEEAYLLASGKKPKETVKKDEKGDPKKDAKHLNHGGEKPGAGPASFEPTNFKTTKDAATAAFEQVYGKSRK
jgi:hypothetical protein